MKKAFVFFVVPFLPFALFGCGGSSSSISSIPLSSSASIPTNVDPVDVDSSLIATEDDYVFAELPDGSYEIAAKDGFSKSVVRIPSSHDGKSVTSIAKEGFAQKPSIQSVSIPGTVTTVKERAFFGAQLCHVFMEEGVKTIEDYAFGEAVVNAEYGWPMRADFFLPASLESFPEINGRNAYSTKFFFADDLSSGAKDGYPGMYSTINGGPHAVYGVKHDENGFLYQPYRNGYRVIGFVGAAKELTFPSSFKGKPVHWVYMPFQLNDGLLEKLTFPSTLTDFNIHYVEAPLKQIIVNDEIETFSASMNMNSKSPLSTNKRDGGIYIGNDRNPYLVYLDADGEKAPDVLRIAEGCRAICGFDISRLGKTGESRKLVLPSTLRSVGSYSFSYAGFEEVEFPKSENLKIIRRGAFTYCNNLSNIRIPYVGTIEVDAFRGCGRDSNTGRFRIETFQVDKGLRELGPPFQHAGRRATQRRQTHRAKRPN